MDSLGGNLPPCYGAIPGEGEQNGALGVGHLPSHLGAHLSHALLASKWPVRKWPKAQKVGLDFFPLHSPSIENQPSSQILHLRSSPSHDFPALPLWHPNPAAQALGFLAVTTSWPFPSRISGQIWVPPAAHPAGGGQRSGWLLGSCSQLSVPKGETSLPARVGRSELLEPEEKLRLTSSCWLVSPVLPATGSGWHSGQGGAAGFGWR